ncbi:vacuolar protein sorting-associated protein 53 A [Gracilaria domingensis]|nr:vacuolar protein sorting-associated protein 53 A [Gracilaria domingensis]
MSRSTFRREEQILPLNPQPADLPELEQISALNIPLDGPIDVSSYLNNRFPSEQQLNANLTNFLDQIDGALYRLDTQLSSLMDRHRNDTNPVNENVQTTLSSLSTAESSLSELRQAAETATKSLTDALEPATPIYTALENTTATSKAMEALITLDDAVAKLEHAATSTSLDNISGHLHVFTAVREPLAVFESQPAPKQLSQLRARAAVATETLRSTVLTEFKRYSDVLSVATSSSPKVDSAVNRLHTACLVAEAMGSTVRAELLGSYIKSRKAAFRAAFEMDKSGFAGVDKRFAWLRKELRVNWARLGGEKVDRGWGRVFPNEWGVARRVAEGIVAELREWTSQTLDIGADRDVAIMIRALSKTKEFEIELDRRFGAKGNASFVGMISESFGPWMGAYVNQEDEHLKIVLDELLRDETWLCEDSTVLKSGTELFLVIKKSMRTCASLDVRQPLFSLHRVFRRHLSSYASALVKRLPGFRENPLADSTNPNEYDRKMRQACAIVNTAEYCSTTVEQLEESLRRTVEQAFMTDIDLSAEREKFSAVAAKGVQSIVSLIDEDLEIDLKAMSSQNWATWPEVGDTSTWAQSMSAKLTAAANDLVKSLEKHHFRFLLEKLAVSFLSRYRKHIYACELMNNFGAQQILLDSSTLKSTLLGLPKSVSAAVPSAFVKQVNREMGNIEAVLKVILAPLDVSVDTYVALVPNGTAEDFQKILEIKGLRRAEAAPLVLNYSRRIGPSQRLKSNRSTPSSPRMSLQNRSPISASVPTSKPELLDVNPNAPESAAENQSAAVGSMISLFDRLGSSLKESGITDRIDQVSSHFESTTDRLKKEAAARGFRFG